MYIHPTTQFHTEVLFKEKAALFKIAQTANNLNMYQHLGGWLIIIHSYNGILLSNKNKQMAGKCNNGSVDTV